jgi:uncharacterized membrane protein
MVGRQAGRPPWRTRLSANTIAVGLVVLLSIGIYAVLSLFRYYTFNSGTYDLVIFDQAVRSYAHFHPGISVAKGIHNFDRANFSVLGDHWSPIIASLAPLYWIFNGPQTLLVAQAVLFALAIPPVWLFTRRALGGGRKATIAAYMVSVAYALSWPVAAAVAFDFHEVAFAPVLTAVALERLQAGKIRPALLALAGLLLVKEDMGLLVAGIGCYLLLSNQHLTRQRLLGAGLILAGLIDTGLATYLLIPAFGGRSDYYWAYYWAGNNMQQLVQHVIAHPASAFKELFTPRIKLDTMLWLFGAFAFLPLLSPITIALLPLILERFLANSFPNWWGTSWQYNAYMIIILVLGAVDGAVRLGRWLEWGRRRLATPAAEPAVALAARPEKVSSELAGSMVAADGLHADGDAAEGLTASSQETASSAAEGGGAGGGTPRDTVGTTVIGNSPTAGSGGARPPARKPSLLGLNVALGAAGVMFVLAILLVPRFGLDPALHSSFYHRTPSEQAAAVAVGKVPSGVVVAAANNVGPELSGRDTDVLWDGEQPTNLQATGVTPPRQVNWVVANVAIREFTFTSIRQQVKYVDALEHSGYKVVFSRDGYIVLHRAT